MKFIFETKRLAFREWNESDASWMMKLNDNPIVIKHTGDSVFKNLDEARQFIQNYSSYKLHDFGRWVVVEKSSQTPIGWCGLRRNEDNEVDIGFRFFEHYWGKGFATESAKACLDYGFSTFDLTEIVGRTAKQNKPAQRVLEKIGMQFWKEGEVHGLADVHYYLKKNHESNNRN